MTDVRSTGAAERDPIVQTTARSVARGSLWALVAAIVPPAYTFVTSIAGARFLGASGLGRLSFIAFVQSTLALMLVLGLPRSFMRHVGEAIGGGQAGRVRPLVRSLFLPFAAAALVGLVSLTAVGLAGGQPRYAWAFAGIACAGAVLHTLPSSLLVGLQRWRDAFVIGIASGAVAVVAKIALLATGHGITALVAVDAAIVTGNVLGTSLLARRAARALLPPDEPVGDLARRVWTFGLASSVAVVINFVVYRRTELFFLEHYSSDAQIALYSIPFSLVDVLVLLPRMMGQVVAPAVATLHGAGDKDRIATSYGRAIRVVLPLSFFATAASVALGPQMVETLYGSEFRRAGDVLVILIATLPFVPLMALSSSVLLGIGKQWVPTAIGAVAAVANIALDFALIPHFAAIGAAIANSSAQIVGALPLVVYTGLCIGSVSLGTRTLARSAVAAAVAGVGSGILVRLLPEPEGIAVGVLAFVALAFPIAWTLRILEADDAAWLAGVAPRRVVDSFVRAARVLRLPTAVQE